MRAQSAVPSKQAEHTHQELMRTLQHTGQELMRALSLRVRISLLITPKCTFQTELRTKQFAFLTYHA
jgi:hypothetical protein